MVGVTLDSLPSGRDVDACRVAITLLLESPAVSLSEVIDERRLLALEKKTNAKTVWIISPDQVIEFEYAETVSFSSAVLANLERGIKYRYLVRDTAPTRRRADELQAFLADLGLSDTLEVRFRPDEYWNVLGRRTEEFVLFEEPQQLVLFYRFPAFGAVDGRWVMAPSADAASRLADLCATWALASVKPPPAT